MKSDVETLNPTRVKLTVHVPFEELASSVAAAYKSLAGQVQVPGFRKGKVPPRVIDQRFGRAVVIQEAVNDALPRLYQQAVTETSVRPIGQPEVDITDLPLGSGADAGALTFTAEVDVRPTLVLPDFSTLAVTVDDLAVTDADVEGEMEALRVRFGTLVGVDRPVETGDVVSLDLNARVGDEDVETATGTTYEVGAGTVLPGLDEAIIGASAGDTATFTAPLAGGEHEGEDAEITVSVVSVKIRELPEVDDDFAQLASEFDTVDELRDDLRSKAENEKVFAQGLQARDKVLEALLEVVDVPVPESVVEEEVHRHLENESRLEDDTHRAEVTEETRKVLREQFLLDAIAEAEEVTVAQEELVEYLVAQAPRYGMDASAFVQAMGSSGQIPALYGEVARRKALAIVLERADVTDTSGAKVELGDPDDELEEIDGVDDVADDADDADDAEAVTAGTAAPADEAPAQDAPAAQEPSADAPAKPKRTRAPKAAAAPAEPDADAAEASADASADAPAKPKRTRAPKAAAASETVDEPAAQTPADADDEAGTEVPSPS